MAEEVTATASPPEPAKMTVDVVGPALGCAWRAWLGGLMRRLVDVLVDATCGAVHACRREPGRGALPPVTEPLLLKPASELARLIATGKVSSEAVVGAFCARIGAIEPQLGAVVDERMSEALDEARRVDKLVRDSVAQRGSKGSEALLASKPLLGVPFTAKDLLAVKGLAFDAGLCSRRGTLAECDADAVAALRTAGAIPLAVTNVSEMAMWWESNNRLYGRTRNPYDLRRTPGGSSGGEGSLVSAAGSALGLGTDIGGSIRMPAFFNGLFGHKASPGLMGLGGQFPQVRGHQLAFLSAGPLCRYAQDLAPTLTVLVGSQQARHRLRLHEPVNIRGIRVHYLTEIDRCFTLSAVHPDVKAAVTDVASHLRDSVGLRVSPVRLPSLRLAFEMWAAMMASGDAPTFRQVLRESGSPMSPGLELLRWLVGQSEHTINAITLALAEGIGPVAKKDSATARSLCARVQQLRVDLESLLGNDGVLLLPTHPEPAPYHGVPTLRAFNFAYAGVFNVLGLPATACPVGLGARSRLPVGVQLVAASDNDRLTLALALEIEKAFGGWRDPAAAATGARANGHVRHV
ncbi:fatty-acid amide hydrolase 2-A isoform X2 [Dermacentor silvarum]|uniref:fatty-acid amide hydrolase 2-A isoform X1 n=1 Tax=Dermacentor silvarum TaxID=543639 RepID=UPI002101839B|nr:fatty-acid amide hydrolase 2-A isoform X1 [Dermacentor silvarum]XP_049527808.1 fatty-acid amide hydrolase 2-A isoform X2 [Dermacentor silvarum]